MGKISFEVNKGGKLKISQEKHDGKVSVNVHENNRYYISAGALVMPLNYDTYIKDNDIQNDFINFHGKN